MRLIYWLLLLIVAAVLTLPVQASLPSGAHPSQRTHLIKVVAVDTQGPLYSGHSVVVTVRGAAGGQATFTIGNQTDLAMQEVAPGSYRGFYTARYTDNLRDAEVIGYLTMPDGRNDSRQGPDVALLGNLCGPQEGARTAPPVASSQPQTTVLGEQPNQPDQSYAPSSYVPVDYPESQVAAEIPTNPTYPPPVDYAEPYPYSPTPYWAYPGYADLGFGYVAPGFSFTYATPGFAISYASSPFYGYPYPVPPWGYPVSPYLGINLTFGFGSVYPTFAYVGYPVPFYAGYPAYVGYAGYPGYFGYAGYPGYAGYAGAVVADPPAMGGAPVLVAAGMRSGHEFNRTAHFGAGSFTARGSGLSRNFAPSRSFSRGTSVGSRSFAPSRSFSRGTSVGSRSFAPSRSFSRGGSVGSYRSAAPRYSARPAFRSPSFRPSFSRPAFGGGRPAFGGGFGGARPSFAPARPAMGGGRPPAGGIVRR